MYKRNVGMHISFSCECGEKLGVKNTKKIRCNSCGRLYYGEIIEYTHDRIWIEDILDSVQMLQVGDSIKKEIRELIKKRLFIEKEERKRLGYCKGCNKNTESEDIQFFCVACGSHLADPK